MIRDPIAYQYGNNGDILHIDCWKSLEQDNAAIGRKALFGTLFYYENDPAIQGKVCPICKLPLTINVTTIGKTY